MEKKNTSNEITLLDIIINIWIGITGTIKNAIRLFGKGLQLLYRNIVITVAFVVIGFGISQYYARSSNKQYEIGAMANLYGIRATEIKELGRQFSFISKEYELSSVSKKLNISEDVANHLIKVDFFDVIDYKKDSIPDRVDFSRKHSLTDTLNVKMDNFVYIQMRMLGTEYADELGNALINYLNDNQISQSYFETYKTALENKIKITNDELTRIDSLAKIKYFNDNTPHQQLRFENNKLIVGEQDTQLFWKDLIKLQRIKSQTEKELMVATSPVVLASEFVLNPKPVNGRTKYALIGILIGLLGAVVVGVTKENYRKCLEFLNK